MIGHAHAGAHLHVRIDQVKVVVARARIHGKVLEGRKMVLQISLPAAFYSAAKIERAAGIQIKNLRVTAAINEKAFQFAQARKVGPAFNTCPCHRWTRSLLAPTVSVLREPIERGVMGSEVGRIRSEPRR